MEDRELRRKQELKREIEGYISERRKGSGLFKNLFKQEPKKEEPLHPTVKPYEEERAGPASEMEKEYEQEQKKGFFASIFGGFTAKEEEPAKTDSEAEQDLKEIARISLHMLKQMPGELIHNFKQTPDYERFKELLRKHQLIK